jgi:hypothetical protein
VPAEQAASKCQARPEAVWWRVPRSALPSTLPDSRRGLRADGLTSACSASAWTSARLLSHAPAAAVNALASSRSSTSRIIASSGTSYARDKGSYRTPSVCSTSAGTSAIHSPIAANEVAPVNAAATAAASSDPSECRTPRGSRGSGTHAK